MTYATYQQVINRYPLVETWGRTETDVSSGMIFYVEKELEGLMSRAFTVPFDAAHPTMTDLAIDLTFARMIHKRDPDKGEKLLDSIYQRVDRIIKGEEALITSSGTLSPGGDSAVVPIWSSTMDYHPSFSMLDAENEYSHVSSELTYEDEQLRK